MKEPKEGDWQEIAVQFWCPFCGKMAGAAVEPEVVIHEFPYCQQFEQMDVLAFICAVRKAYVSNFLVEQKGEHVGE